MRLLEARDKAMIRPLVVLHMTPYHRQWGIVPFQPKLLCQLGPPALEKISKRTSRSSVALKMLFGGKGSLGISGSS